MVPSDREIPRAVNEGVPIVLARPESDASAAFRDLADFYDSPSSSTLEPTAEKRNSMFSRLAGKKA